MDTPDYDVFLSYNSSDNPAVEAIAKRLLSEKITPWFDRWNLVPGEPWQPAIEEALKKCTSCAVFIGPEGIGPWQNEEMRAAIDRRVSGRGFRVIPVLLPGGQRGERSRLPDFLVSNTWVEFQKSLDDPNALRRLVCGILGRAPGAGTDLPIMTGIRPYRGLETFQIEDRPFFFGRTAATGWLVNELRLSPKEKEANRFLAIIGASGSGKSSLARAGLIPAIMDGAIEGSQNWPILIMRPGPDPLECLAIKLSAHPVVGKFMPPVKEIIDGCLRDARQLHWVVSHALNDAEESRRVLILLDQFEEIFTLCQKEELRSALIENILHAATIFRGQTIMVLTMRADFIARCLRYEKFAAALSDHQFLVSPMSHEEIRCAIECPARLLNCELEAGLTEALIYDFKNQPGALPLLQHALSELWERRKDQRLTLIDYKEIGRLEGALESYANSVYDKFDDRNKQICKGVFLRLIQPGEGTEDTKRRMSLKDLESSERDAGPISQVIKELADSRLVTTEKGEGRQGEGIVEVAHEALIRGWSKLRDWIDSDREGLRIHRRVSDAAMEWDQFGRDESYLFRGSRLAEANEWMHSNFGMLNQLESDFIRASLAAREKHEKETQKAQKRKVQRAITAAVLALSSTAIILYYYLDAKEQRRGAEEQGMRARQEALNARLVRASELWKHDPETAQKLIDHEDKFPDELKDFCWNYLHRLSNRLISRQTFEAHTKEVFSVAFSRDGRTIASASDDGTVRLWDAVSGEEKKAVSPLIGHDGAVCSVAFSRDGRTVASAGKDRTIRLWDAVSGEEKKAASPLIGHGGPVYAVTFSPDGQTLASGSADQTVRLWDAASGNWRATLTGHADAISSVAFSWDGQFLASGSDDRTVRLWEASSGGLLATFTDHSEPVWSVAFSKDNQTLASAGVDGIVRLWDVARKKLRHALPRYGSRVSSVAFSPSPEGEILALATDGRAVVLWDAENGHELNIRKGHKGYVSSVAFSPDGKLLASGSGDSTIRLWATTTEGMPTTLFSDLGLYFSLLAFSPDSKTIAFAINSDRDDKTVKLWDVANRRLRATLIGHEDTVQSVVFSPDGETIASAGADRTVRLWDASDARLRATLIGHEDTVQSVVFSPDGKTIASAGDDGKVRLWDVANGKLHATLTGFGKTVQSVVFSPDGKTIASAGEDRNVRLWDAVSGKEKKASPLIGHGAEVLCLAYSPDGMTLASGSADQSIMLWDADSGGLRAKLTDHNSGVHWLAFFPDKRTLASASHDGTIKLWRSKGEEAGK